MRSLLVVGEGFDEVAARVRRGGLWEVIYPCHGPKELAALLVDQPDHSIERLDICDHGSSGFIMLGGRVLFQSDRDPESPLINSALVVGFRDKLTATAQVRLLGCETGGAWRRRKEGRLLLLKLARLLNQDCHPRSNRVVFGTIVGVQSSDFDGQGFLHTSDLTMLFSSCAALDHEAPAYDDRLGHVADLRGDITIDAPKEVRP